MSLGRNQVLRSVLSVCPDDPEDTGYRRFLDETLSPEGTLELLIEPKRGISLEFLRASSVIGLLHATEKSTYLNDYLWLIVPSDIVYYLRTNPDQFVTRMKAEGVHRVWPNVPLEPQARAGSPPGIPSLSGILSIIGSNTAPLTKRAGEDITWAIIDTDVRDSHQYFQRVRPTITRYHVDAHSGVGPPRAFNSAVTANHGSHIAGIFHSVAPYASIISIALECEKKAGPTAPWIVKDIGHLEAALQWIGSQPDIDGVNISLATHPKYQDRLAGQSPGCRRINDLVDMDKIVVVAAGNYGEDNNRYYEVSITDPANAYGAITVGACDSDDPEKFGICSFSSRGPTADGREKPDIVAPGIDIESCGHLSDTDLSTQSGTSQATALVSGTCAVLLSQKQPGIVRRTQVVSCLFDPMAVVTMGRVKTYQGAGMVSVSGALQVAKSKGYV